MTVPDNSVSMYSKLASSMSLRCGHALATQFDICRVSRVCSYVSCLCLMILVFIYMGFKSTRENSSIMYGSGRFDIVRSYPKDGVGTSIEISKDFNVSVFNTFCDRNTDLVAIIPVYSAADNFNRRHTIRDTVGRNCVKFRCAIFFIVGVSKNESVNMDVKTEYTLKKDILMVNKMDTYRELSNKAVAMLDWLVRFCQRPKYVIHIIDDTYPNIGYFLDRMNAIKQTQYIFGMKARRSPVIRDNSSKWYATTADYPYTHYPPYTPGPAYAFLNRDSQILRDAAYKARYFWIEDVWLTGIVREKAGFGIVPAKRSILDTPSTQDPNIWRKHLCVHQVTLSGFYDIYNATLKQTSVSILSKALDWFIE